MVPLGGGASITPAERERLESWARPGLPTWCAGWQDDGPKWLVGVCDDTTLRTRQAVSVLGRSAPIGTFAADHPFSVLEKVEEQLWEIVSPASLHDRVYEWGVDIKQNRVAIEVSDQATAGELKVLLERHRLLAFTTITLGSLLVIGEPCTPDKSE